LAFRGINDIEKNAKAGTNLFNNLIFRNIVLSLVATLGLYFISSILFFEPWHMITSFLQYILLASSYINVLNVYAFANVHDVSWGTKGDNTTQTDLGVVGKAKDNKVDVAVPEDEKDINAAYEDALAVINSKPPTIEQKRSPSQKQEDYYRQFRTNVLLAWTLSNGALAIAITQTTTRSNASTSIAGYMAFVLYSVAGLAFFRFVGATSYLVVRLFAGE